MTKKKSSEKSEEYKNPATFFPMSEGAFDSKLTAYAWEIIKETINDLDDPKIVSIADALGVTWKRLNSFLVSSDKSDEAKKLMIIRREHARAEKIIERRLAEFQAKKKAKSE